MKSSTHLSVLAALLAAFALPAPAIAQTYDFDDDPEIEAGNQATARDGVVLNGNNVTIDGDVILEIAEANCEFFSNTALLSKVEQTNITINTDAGLTVDTSECVEDDFPNFTGIAIDSPDAPDSTATATVTINGALVVPEEFGTAIESSGDITAATVTIGANGTVTGNARFGHTGDLTATNNGTVNGTWLFLNGGDVTATNEGTMEGSWGFGNTGDTTFTNNGTLDGRVTVDGGTGSNNVAPDREATIINNGTLTATYSYAILIDNSAYTETEKNEDDEDVMVRNFATTITNNETIDGDVFIGPSGGHVFRNNGIDDDLDDTVLNGMNGTVIFGHGNGVPLESLRATYQNFGTHVGGDVDNALVDDALAVHVQSGFTGQTILGGYDEELERHTIEGVNITNAFGGSIFGSILVEGDDSHGFTNQGTLDGRVRFEGLGENLVTLSGGTIFTSEEEGDDENTDLALINTGGGIDRVILSGTFLSPNEIVEPEEGEEPEPTEQVDMTLIDLGDGDDFATLSSGGLIGATTALDGGAGNDHITITPNSNAALVIEGAISGGADVDTLEVNGGTSGAVTEITDGQEYTNFENFRVTSGEVHLNLTDEVEAVEAQEATEDMEAVEAVEAVDATFFGVDGGDLSIGEGAVLRLGQKGSGTDGADFIRHFAAMTGTNEGTLVFDTKTEIQNADMGASFTNAGTGTFGFAVVAETDEETGVASILSQGALYDSATSGMERLVLEAGSSIGLVLDHLTLATELAEDSPFFRDAVIPEGGRDLFSELKFDVVYTPAGIVRTITPGEEDDDPDTIEDEDITDGFDLEAAGINLVRDNPFYAFAFDVDGTGDQTIVSIIASRKPAFAFSLGQMGQDPGAGSVLDQIFEDTLAYDCSNPADASQEASCAIDDDIRDLARMGFGAYQRGVRGIEPNRHSGLWEGMLNNHKMTLGVVSLRSATYRADAGGMSPTAQYSALPNYSTSNDVMSVASQQEGITGVNAGSIWESNRFWIQGFGGLSDRETSATDAGHQTTNGGVVLGYDRRVGRTQMFGIFASYGLADVSSSNIDQEELSINSYSGGVYYTAFSRTTSAEVSLSGGGSNIEGDRMPFLGGGTASYDTSGWHVALRGAADTNMKAGRFLITPNAAFQYTFMRQGEYDETGTSPALLSVDGINMHSVETTLGVNAGLPLRMGRLAALPKFKLAWQHEFLDDTGDVDATLINVPSAGSFSAAAIEVPADRVTTGFGLDLASRGGTTFTMGYDFSLGSDFQAHGGAMTFRFPF